jgi:hypothetical protein
LSGGAVCSAWHRHIGRAIGQAQCSRFRAYPRDSLYVTAARVEILIFDSHALGGKALLDVLDVSLATFGHIKVVSLPLVRRLYNLLKMVCRQRLGRVQGGDAHDGRQPDPLTCERRGRLLARSAIGFVVHVEQ